MFLLSGLLVIFSFRWQVVDASKFNLLAEQRFQDTAIPALRGTIYARDGSTLAYSDPRYDVYVYMVDLLFFENKGLQTREEFVRKLSTSLDISAENLDKLIKDNYAKGQLSIKIAANVTLQIRQQIKSLRIDQDKSLPAAKQRNLIGYTFSDVSKRIYPEGKLAAQVLGLTATTNTGTIIGVGGLERGWDGDLTGIPGVVSGERDARGVAVGTASEKTVEAIPGRSIYTSIDKKLQGIVEEQLKKGVEKYSATSGTIVIMDPKTGQVMAMANYPDYDPNTRETTNPQIAFGNKAISEPYEIGSVGKIFTLASAIDNNVVTPDSVILQGHQGCERITDELEPVCTHDKLPQPPMPIKNAFALSDNIYFLHLGQLIKPEVFSDYLDRFGIGKSTGSDVDPASESYGKLKDWQRWNIADISAYSYGHSYEVSALQATTAVAAVANGGVRMKPYIVTKVKEADGKEINIQPQPVERVIKKTTTPQMDAMMHTIYENNIFYWEHYYDGLRKYNIAMKSGTALIPFKDGSGYSNAINATYVGYDASPDRTFVMFVRLERPVGDLASQNARIVWLETFNQFRDYLGVRKIGQF